LKAGGFDKRNAGTQIMTVDKLFIFHGNLCLGAREEMEEPGEGQLLKSMNNKST
jgi:hypothetical protein